MFEKLKEMVDGAKSIALFTHTHPDGDALGSSFALMLGLIQMGKSAKVFLLGEVCETKEYKCICGKEEMSDITAKDCDLAIALDCADFNRIELCEEELPQKTAAIDHHISHKPFADESIVMDVPATGEIVFDILCEWGVSITPQMADNIYIAIASDTGNFKFSSTTPKTHRIAARLMELGADFAKISRELFHKLSREYLSLFQIALSRLEIFADGCGCIMYLSDEDFEKSGLSDDLAGDIVNLPGKIEGVEVGAYIRRRDDGFKVSLRSNEFVNVSEIAACFGGGGHIRAAGFSSDLSLDKLKKSLCEKIENAIREL